MIKIFIGMGLLVADVFGAPTLGAVVLSPTTAGVGLATSITVQASIVDATLIQGSVNLLRLNADGSTVILGVLHDDGVNGDAAAGDKIFTVVVSIAPLNSGPIELQVSAAFRGVLQRVRSMTLTIIAQAPDAPQQAVALLSRNLLQANLAASIAAFVDADHAAQILNSLNATGLQTLAAAFASARIIATSPGLVVFTASWTLQAGTALPLEFSLTPNSSGQWLISSW